MTSISVKHLFQGTIDEVFDAVINADRYPVVSRLVHVHRLCAAKSGDKDGIGTQREVELGFVWFKEEFTAFERPHRVDYKIFESRPSFDHQHGSFSFKKQGKNTEVTWSTTVNVPLALPPKLAEKMTEWVLKAAFKSTLMVLDRKLRAKK